jgi:hypothetical protein
MCRQRSKVAAKNKMIASDTTPTFSERSLVLIVLTGDSFIVLPVQIFWVSNRFGCLALLATGGEDMFSHIHAHFPTPHLMGRMSNV